ncbi:aminoacyl--tRNA ligase-related protein [Patescibacteria group bacterium]
MKQSKLFCKTLKEAPKDEKSTNAQLLSRGGFVFKEMAGVYSYLPLGLKVLRNIENIIREEVERIEGQEILMTVFQPKSLWQETGRWSKEMGKVMYKCKEGNKEIGLGPTHEEMLTDIIRHHIKSYEDLPLYLYQIQTKFRKEPRARSGLLRGREFDMKDLYSFHSSQEDFKKYYKRAIQAYFKILKRCGLKAIITEASGAGFTKEYTHEFQVLSRGGEDNIVFCEKHHFSQNKEIAKLKEGDKCPVCKKILKQEKSIEVGNIFPLGTKYSQKMKAFFADKDGRRKPIVMGCYGLGPSRIMGAVVEVHHDKKGIIWPKEISPFQVHLIQIERTQKVKKAAEKLCEDLQKRNLEVLYDDRTDKTPGEKFVEADLIGIPYRLVVSEKTLKKNSVEVKKRNSQNLKLIKIKNLNQIINYDK